MARNADDEGLQLRLRELAQRYTHAEIARKTGTSQMNVGRYLRGTRVPAGFCIALCREFGVNPSWLLAGEGAELLSDVAQRHGSLAGDLLKLVEAMTAVTKLKLGTFASHADTKRLRELNDALAAYERLRGALNQQSRGLLQQTLAQFGAALAAMDVPRAGALRRTAEQVARLCDDEALGRQLMEMQSHHAFLSGRIGEALLLLRRRFSLEIANGRIETDDAVRQCMRLVIALHDSGKHDDARRTAESALALCAGEAERLPTVAHLGIFLGQLLAGSGDVNRALAVQHKWLPMAAGRQREVGQASLLRTQLLAGVLTFEEALQAPGLAQPKHLHILEWATALEHQHTIRACNHYFTQPQAREVLERSALPHYAPFLARALARNNARILPEWRARRRELGDGVSALVADVYEAQLCRLCGERAAAARLTRKTAAAVNENMDLALLATHWANVFAVGDKSQIAKAAAELARKISLGARLLKSLLPRVSGPADDRP